MSNQDPEVRGIFAGLAVRHMIETVEKKMAAGEHVSAQPTSEEEEKSLKQARELNRKSREKNQNSVEG